MAETGSLAVTGPLSSLRVALVHDYLNQQGGAEKVAAVLCQMFPDAPIYTSVYHPDAMDDFWRTVDVRTSFMQRISPRLPVAKPLLPLYPLAFESFDLSGYDLVLSSSSTFAKGVITGAVACHVCYCYTPSRFAWMYGQYTARQRLTWGGRLVLPAIVSPLRVWDYSAAQRVDHFVAISHAVAARIAKHYRRTASVVEPPVDLSVLRPSTEVGDYLLVAARLAAYKRIDLAVEACNRGCVPLIVAGDGPDRSRLERMAGATVRFLGRVSDDEMGVLMSRCRALLWPGEEDFGLALVEAQACGRPVIAFDAGGARETVADGRTGLLFRPQTVEALEDAIHRLERTDFDSRDLRRSAERFSVQRFVDRLTAEMEGAWNRHSGATGERLLVSGPETKSKGEGG